MRQIINSTLSIRFTYKEAGQAAMAMASKLLEGWKVKETQLPTPNNSGFYLLVKKADIS